MDDLFHIEKDESLSNWVEYFRKINDKNDWCLGLILGQPGIIKNEFTRQNFNALMTQKLAELLNTLSYDERIAIKRNINVYVTGPISFTLENLDQNPEEKKQQSWSDDENENENNDVSSSSSSSRPRGTPSSYEEMQRNLERWQKDRVFSKD